MLGYDFTIKENSLFSTFDPPFENRYTNTPASEKEQARQNVEN